MNAAEDLIFRLMGDTSNYTNSLKKAERDLKAFEDVVSSSKTGIFGASLGNIDSQIGKTIANSFSNGIKSGIQFSGTGVTAVVNSTLKGIFSGFGAGLGNGITSLITAPLGAAIGGITGLLTGSLKAGLDGMVSFFATGFGLIFQGMKSFVSETIRLGIEFQTTATMFEIFTGSVEKGNKLLGELRQVSIVSPFTFSQISGPAQTLLGMGEIVENVTPIISRLGDVAAGDTDRLQRLALAYGQVGAAGRFMGTELRQFTEAGVGVADFAATMGVSTEQFRVLMRIGAIGPSVVAQTIERLTSAGGRFADMNVRMNKTFAGAWNSLKETYELGLGKFASEFFNKSQLAEGLLYVSSIIRDLIPGLEQAGASLGNFVGLAVQGFKEIANVGKEIGAILFRAFVGNFDMGQNKMESFAKMFLVSVISIEKAIGTLAIRMRQLMSHAQDMYETWLNPINPEEHKKFFAEREDKQKDIKQKRAFIERLENDYNNAKNKYETARDAVFGRKIFGHEKHVEKLRLEMEAEKKQLMEKLIEFQKMVEDYEKWIEKNSPLAAREKERKKRQAERDELEKGIKDIEKINPNEKADEFFKRIEIHRDLQKGQNFWKHLFGDPKVVYDYYGAVFTGIYESIQNQILRRPIKLGLKESLDPDLKAFIETMEGKLGKSGKQDTEYEKMTQTMRGFDEYIDKKKLEIWKNRIDSPFPAFGALIAGEEVKGLDDLRQAGFAELIKDRLDKRRNAAGKDSFGSGDLVGTAGAGEIYNRSVAFGNRALNVQEEVRNILKEMKEEDKRQHDERIEIEKAIRDFLKENPGVGVKAKRM